MHAIEQRKPMSLTDDDKKWINDSINGAIATSESRLMAAIERVETSLLTEFHKWAGPLEMRVRSHSTAIRAADLEMEALVERVDKLETRP
jgi:hypothetical protein